MAFSSSERSSGVPPGVDRPFEVADPACITDHHRLETGFREGLGHAEITIDQLSDHDRVGSRPASPSSVDQVTLSAPISMSRAPVTSATP